jgi:hypothetical protein
LVGHGRFLWKSEKETGRLPPVPDGAQTGESTIQKPACLQWKTDMLILPSRHLFLPPSMRGFHKIDLLLRKIKKNSIIFAIVDADRLHILTTATIETLEG